MRYFSTLKLKKTVFLLAILCLSFANYHCTNINENLMDAITNGDLARVKTLVAKGADVNYKAGNGRLPLSWAAAKGNFEIVKYLIEKGAKEMRGTLLKTYTFHY